VHDREPLHLLDLAFRRTQKVHPSHRRKEAVTQLAFIAPSLTNYAIPAQAGTHSAAGVELSDGTRSQKFANPGAWGSMGPGLRRDGEKK
jgi:hypothetical protein